MIFPEDFEQDAFSEAEEISDWAFDYENMRFLKNMNNPYIVTGKEALQGWIFKVLKTPKNTFLDYPEDFGQIFKTLKGETDFEFLQEELEGMITDALLASPYIENVRGFYFEREDETIYVEFTVDTVYGEIKSGMELDFD